ncbi:MAG: cytidine deaminase [Flavobacteriaceae bacterium]|nr:MAG: cytidine deaminase [Flavobacteriaceae bacterium]
MLPIHVYLRVENRHVGFDLTIYESEAELSPADLDLLKKARQAREGAYAPYSGFKVGAAVLLESGQIVIGNNQENASYPSGLCAERVAVFQAGARFPDSRIKSIAITATGRVARLEIPAAPCGNCRQSILEYEARQGEPIRILMQGEAGVIYECPSVASLLPLGFDGSFLS